MRAFIAVEPSPALKHAIARATADQLRGTGGYRAVPEAQLHVTLRFFAALHEDRVDAVVQALHAIAAAHKPFAVDVDGALSTFSPRRAHVLWLALGDVDGKLAALAQSVDDALFAIGMERTERPFQAHLTVARAKSRGRLHPPKPAASSTTIGTLDVDALVLFSSRTSSSGAIHTPVARVPFA